MLAGGAGAQLDQQIVQLQQLVQQQGQQHAQQLQQLQQQGQQHGQQLQQLQQQGQQHGQQLQQLQQQGQQHGQQLQQILQLLQGQQGGPQTRRRIAEARMEAGRGVNSLLQVDVPLAPVPINTGAAIGTVPANYPATLLHLQTMPAAQATALLQAYSLDTGGNVQAKRQRLAAHLGVRLP